MEARPGIGWPSWTASDDLILDHIVVDPANPATIYVAAWRLDTADGGLWVSRDGGRSWSEVEGLHGQSIRAFAQAPSDPRMLIAGTLEGVFRSSDARRLLDADQPAGQPGDSRGGVAGDRSARIRT